MRATVVSILALVIVVLSVSAFAQQERPESPQRNPGQAERPQRPRLEPLPDLKDHAIAKFVGTWKGTATHHAPGQSEPSTVQMTEKAEWKLDGNAIFVEGRGVMQDPDTGEERVVHDALGVIRYEPDSRKLMFYGFKAGEPNNEAELETLDNGDLRWTMQPAPNAMVRFTVKITDDAYTEIGEFSRDGGVNYTPFMEMNLKKVK